MSSRRILLFGMAALSVVGVLLLYDAATLLADHHSLLLSSASSSSSSNADSSPNRRAMRKAQVKSLNDGVSNVISKRHIVNNNNNNLTTEEQQEQATTPATTAKTKKKITVPYHDVHSGETITAYLERRSLRNRILLIPVNSGYLDFGVNLLCSLERTTSRLASDFPRLHNNNRSRLLSSKTKNVGIGYTFVAMDDQVDAGLRKMHLPVFRDPDMPFVSEKSASWSDPKFHRIVCTKLVPVLRALRQGLDVVLSDADIVFRRDPTRYLDSKVPPTTSAGDDEEEDEHRSQQQHLLDMAFSIGSCHRDLPDNLDLTRAGDGLAKLNTGFYVASPRRPQLIHLFEQALQRCRKSGEVAAAHHHNYKRGDDGGAIEIEGDQPAMNAVLDANIHSPNVNKDATAVRYGFFDGCLFANGCIFFKHLCANSSSLDPASDKALAILRKGGKMPHEKISSSSSSTLLKPGYVRRDDPVLVHANFLVGKEDKIHHLQKAGLWDDACIERWKTVMDS